MKDDQGKEIKFSEVKELYRSLMCKNRRQLAVGLLTVVLAGLIIACGSLYESLSLVVLGAVVGFEAARISAVLIYSMIVHKDMYDRLKETYGEEEDGRYYGISSISPESRRSHSVGFPAIRRKNAKNHLLFSQTAL